MAPEINMAPAYLLDAAGGLVIAFLGLWVLTLRPRTRPTLALGAFCVFFGAVFLVQNLISPTASSAIGFLLFTFVLVPFAVASVFALASVSPGPLGSSERGAFWGVVAGVVALALVWSATTHALLLPGGLAQSATGLLAQVTDFGFALLLVALVGAVPLMAVRAARAHGPVARRQAILLASALVLWPGFTVGAFLVGTGGFTSGAVGPVWLPFALLAVLFASGLLFLAQTTQPTERRAARNAALLCFAMPLVGVVSVPLWGAAGGFGATRIATVLLLVYAIVRHHLLGIDAKVRFAIKTSTIAAVFLAVLFIVANIAQNFLGGQYGVVVGGAAAGLLFFAMAPIQRAAERLAEKAVPTTSNAISKTRGSRAEESYRAMLRRHLRDGVVTRDEERSLAHLAGELRTDAGRAFELREAVEKEVT